MSKTTSPVFDGSQLPNVTRQRIREAARARAVLVTQNSCRPGGVRLLKARPRVGGLAYVVYQDTDHERFRRVERLAVAEYRRLAEAS